MIIQSISQISSPTRPKALILIEILLANIFFSLKLRRSAVASWLISLSLLITYVCTSRFLRSFFRLDVTVPRQLIHLTKGRYIVVANHKRMVDGHLIIASLPFRVFFTLLPIRSFTANIYFRHWWQRLLLLPLGCFRAYSTDGKLSGVKGALSLSDRGQLLLIFPEGRRVRSRTKAEVKVGIGYLAKKREFTIIPVFIQNKKNSQANKTKIIWGKPFKLSQTMQSKDLQALSEQIFNRVLLLPHSY